jgi:hypothetical protein
MPALTPDSIALFTALISFAATVVQVSPRRQTKGRVRRPPGARRRIAARRVSVRRPARSR